MPRSVVQLENRKRMAKGEGRYQGPKAYVPPLLRGPPGVTGCLTKDGTVFPMDGLRADAAGSKIGTEVKDGWLPPFGGVPSPQALFLEKYAPPSIGLGSLRSYLYSLIPLKVIDSGGEFRSPSQSNQHLFPECT